MSINLPVETRSLNSYLQQVYGLFRITPASLLYTNLHRHAVQRNQSNESGEWLIHPNWWMMSSIWNRRPSGMAPPPLIPSECHPRLICTNLINTLTGTPGLFTEESVAAVMRTRTHTCACMLPRWAFESPDGGRRRMMIALNSNSLSLTDTRNNTHTLLHTHSTKCVPLLVWGYVVIGDYFGPQYTSNCSLSDMIRLWSDSAPD